MNEELIPFTGIELAFIAAYLLSLIGIGWAGYRARREDSLRDFYLGGRGIGFVVLLLTLYSTQYSGNTLFGFSGRTYRIGYAWAMSLHFMTAIVVFYLILAPQLFRLSRKHGFITPTDFLRYRFQSRSLCLVATIVMIVAIANYLLAQLMAMGNALEGLTNFDPKTAYIVGVVVLAAIVVVYETLGGFRAVAWTDVVQGSVLLVGFMVLLGMVFAEFGTLEDATRELLQREAVSFDQETGKQETGKQEKGKHETGKSATGKSASTTGSKVLPPEPLGSCEWFSYILLVGIGGALYPQAIQRIYAARSARSLRLSLAVMAFLPLTTALVALVVGIIGLAHVPDLIHEQIGPGGELLKIDRADTVLTVLCRRIQEGSTFGRWLVVVLFSAILAAIMSTADSVLLSISSMFTKDIYAQYVRPNAAEAELTRLGKYCSWTLIVTLVALAIAMRGSTTLIQLLDRKFDMLIQLSPAFFLGLHWRRLRAGPTLAGMLLGLAIALGFAALGIRRVGGFHPGLFGLAANLVVAVCGSFLGKVDAVTKQNDI